MTAIPDGQAVAQTYREFIAALQHWYSDTTHLNDAGLRAQIDIDEGIILNTQATYWVLQLIETIEYHILLPNDLFSPAVELFANTLSIEALSDQNSELCLSILGLLFQYYTMHHLYSHPDCQRIFALLRQRTAPSKYSLDDNLRSFAYLARGLPHDKVTFRKYFQLPISDPFYSSFEVHCKLLLPKLFENTIARTCPALVARHKAEQQRRDDIYAHQASGLSQHAALLATSFPVNSETNQLPQYSLFSLEADESIHGGDSTKRTLSDVTKKMSLLVYIVEWILLVSRYHADAPAILSRWVILLCGVFQRSIVYTTQNPTSRIAISLSLQLFRCYSHIFQTIASLYNTMLPCSEQFMVVDDDEPIDEIDPSASNIPVTPSHSMLLTGDTLSAFSASTPRPSIAGLSSRGGGEHPRSASSAAWDALHTPAISMHLPSTAGGRPSTLRQYLISHRKLQPQIVAVYFSLLLFFSHDSFLYQLTSLLPIFQQYDARVEAIQAINCIIRLLLLIAKQHHFHVRIDQHYRELLQSSPSSNLDQSEFGDVFSSKLFSAGVIPTVSSQNQQHHHPLPLGDATPSLHSTALTNEAFMTPSMIASIPSIPLSAGGDSAFVDSQPSGSAPPAADLAAQVAQIRRLQTLRFYVPVPTDVTSIDVTFGWDALFTEGDDVQGAVLNLFDQIQSLITSSHGNAPMTKTIIGSHAEHDYDDDIDNDPVESFVRTDVLIGREFSSILAHLSGTMSSHNLVGLVTDLFRTITSLEHVLPTMKKPSFTTAVTSQDKSTNQQSSPSPSNQLTPTGEPPLNAASPFSSKQPASMPNSVSQALHEQDDDIVPPIDIISILHIFQLLWMNQNNSFGLAKLITAFLAHDVYQRVYDAIRILYMVLHIQPQSAPAYLDAITHISRQIARPSTALTASTTAEFSSEPASSAPLATFRPSRPLSGDCTAADVSLGVNRARSVSPQLCATSTSNHDQSLPFDLAMAPGEDARQSAQRANSHDFSTHPPLPFPLPAKKSGRLEQNIASFAISTLCQEVEAREHFLLDFSSALAQLLVTVTTVHHCVCDLTSYPCTDSNCEWFYQTTNEHCGTTERQKHGTINKSVLKNMLDLFARKHVHKHLFAPFFAVCLRGKLVYGIFISIIGLKGVLDMCSFFMDRPQELPGNYSPNEIYSLSHDIVNTIFTASCLYPQQPPILNSSILLPSPAEDFDAAASPSMPFLSHVPSASISTIGFNPMSPSLVPSIAIAPQQSAPIFASTSNSSVAPLGLVSPFVTTAAQASQCSTRVFDSFKDNPVQFLTFSQFFSSFSAQQGNADQQIQADSLQQALLGQVNGANVFAQASMAQQTEQPSLAAAAAAAGGAAVTLQPFNASDRIQSPYLSLLAQVLIAMYPPRNTIISPGLLPCFGITPSTLCAQGHFTIVPLCNDMLVAMHSSLRRIIRNSHSSTQLRPLPDSSTFSSLSLTSFIMSRIPPVLTAEDFDIVNGSTSHRGGPSSVISPQLIFITNADRRDDITAAHNAIFFSSFSALPPLSPQSSLLSSAPANSPITRASTTALNALLSACLPIDLTIPWLNTSQSDLSAIPTQCRTLCQQTSCGAVGRRNIHILLSRNSRTSLNSSPSPSAASTTNSATPHAHHSNSSITSADVNALNYFLDAVGIVEPIHTFRSSKQSNVLASPSSALSSLFNQLSTAQAVGTAVAIATPILAFVGWMLLRGAPRGAAAHNAVDDLRNQRVAQMDQSFSEPPQPAAVVVVPPPPVEKITDNSITELPVFANDIWLNDDSLPGSFSESNFEIVPHFQRPVPPALLEAVEIVSPIDDIVDADIVTADIIGDFPSSLNYSDIIGNLPTDQLSSDLETNSVLHVVNQADLLEEDIIDYDAVIEGYSNDVIAVEDTNSLLDGLTAIHHESNQLQPDTLGRDWEIALEQHQNVTQSQNDV